MTLVNKFRRGMLDGLRKASALTNEYTRIGRLKIDMLAIKKELEEKLLELGGRVYQLSRKDQSTALPTDSRISHLISEIRKLDEELERVEKELENIKKMGV